MMLMIEIREYGDLPTEVDYNRLKSVWPGCVEEKPDSWYTITGSKHRLESDEVQELVSMGINIKIHPMPGCMLQKIKDRKEWKHGEKIQIEDTKNGDVVQITVPDIGLLQINDVTWLEDACTDELQSMLSEGWRLLAVCPPNASRRPDYILGRRNVS